MYNEKPKFNLGENVYISIDKITISSKEIMNTSTNLISHLSNLFESIEDDLTFEILGDAGKINDFISSISSFTKNELQEIKIKSKLAIEKAEKRKIKIYKLKEENNQLKEKIKEEEDEKRQLILNIDEISKQYNEIYQENNLIKQKSNLELIDKNNDKILKEKYLIQINNMQKDLDFLKEKNKTYENNMTKFKRMSVILEEKNKKLNNQLGTQTVQFLSKINEQKEKNNLINSLRLKNDELNKKEKYYLNQIESWKNKCKSLEEKIDNSITKNLYNKFSESIHINEKNNRKSGKKIIPLRINAIKDSSESSEEDLNNENMKYKTYSNLNDLLRTVSEKSIRKNRDIIDDKIEKDIKYNLYDIDIDYFFEIYLNIYDNFFI